MTATEEAQDVPTSFGFVFDEQVMNQWFNGRVQAFEENNMMMQQEVMDWYNNVVTQSQVSF